MEAGGHWSATAGMFPQEPTQTTAELLLTLIETVQVRGIFVSTCFVHLKKKTKENVGTLVNNHIDGGKGFPEDVS